MFFYAPTKWYMQEDVSVSCDFVNYYFLFVCRPMSFF